VTSNSYEIEAVPQGTQAAKDAKCAILSVDQAGRKKVSNTATDVKECW
jgi:type IV pilus assembly protein PilE